MNKDYREGFDDAIEAMTEYLDKLELKSMKCMELSMLMGMMGEWNNQRTYKENINFAKYKCEQVKIHWLLLNPKYSLIGDIK